MGARIWLLPEPGDDVWTRSSCFRSAGTEWDEWDGVWGGGASDCLSMVLSVGLLLLPFSHDVLCVASGGEKKCCYQVVRDKKDDRYYVARGQLSILQLKVSRGTSEEECVVTTTYALLHRPP